MAKLDLKKEISFGGLGGKGGKSRGKMPVKTSINLIVKKESFFQTKRAIPVIIGTVIIGVILLFVLFVRPLYTLVTADAKANELRTQLEEMQSMINANGDVEKEYAHYTTAGMTNEELVRVDRAKVMELVEDAVVKNGVVNNWSLTENIATLQVRGSSLAELNQIAAALEKDPIVDRCVINTANRGASTDKNGLVAVTFTVYLNDANTAEEAAEMGEEAQE